MLGQPQVRDQQARSHSSGDCGEPLKKISLRLVHKTAAGPLKLIERWFRELTQKRSRLGTFHLVREFIDTVKEYIQS